MQPWKRRGFVFLLASSLLLLHACSAPLEGSRQVVRQAVETTPHGQGDFHAVLINGGKRRESNLYSHLDHLRSLVAILEASEVEPEHIAIFSGDGPDPAKDLATREGETHPDSWILPPKSIGNLIRSPIVYVDSRIEGFELQPAKQAELRKWFEGPGQALAAGDTLLFYVTDHGQRNPDDPSNNTINLWEETLSVDELRGLLARLDRDVRVVMVMSQCYSGSFAHAIQGSGYGLPTGNVCGYFSTTQDRQAHGCYAEISGKDDVGHSHRLFAALDSGGSLADAHREVLVSDDTPDVPFAASSFFLEQQLARAAEGARSPLPVFVDGLLQEALVDRRRWEQEIRLLDSLGQTFGFGSPRSLAALEQRVEELSEFSERLDSYAERWKSVLDGLREENWEDFRKAHPVWSPRLDPSVLVSLDSEKRRAETEELLGDLLAFTARDLRREAQLENVHWKWKEAKAGHYRAEVRLGVLLRMRTLLMDIAGRHYLEHQAPEGERSSYAALAVCEDLPLTGPRRLAKRKARRPEPFPTLEEEQELLDQVLPAWLGIRYGPARAAQQRLLGLSPGAVRVLEVVPDSPAAAATLQVGDLILGPRGESFTKNGSIRRWTMLGELGVPTPLRLLRNEQEMEVTIRLAAFPLKLPSLPGPPEIGSTAPALELDYFGGVRAPDPRQDRLLFFWATWCSFCKKAIPELMAFEQARGIPVVAITDEEPYEIEAFSRENPITLPEIIATDPQRISFQSFGVSGTPTFVLVDGAGVVLRQWTGYSAKKGLEIEGWQWGETAAQ